MPWIKIRNSSTVMYYFDPSKHVACYLKKKKNKNVSDIYVTKDFSATYQLPSLCLSTSSEVVALKGSGEEPQRLLENELCCEEGISWQRRPTRRSRAALPRPDSPSPAAAPEPRSPATRTAAPELRPTDSCF